MNRENELKDILKKPVVHKLSTILSYCSNKTVLDIGCVGQDFTEKETDWVHGQVKKVALHLIGVDTNKPMIKQLKEKGFTVFSADEIDKDVIPRPDIILMADVIEHVDNVVSFLQFYRQFCSDNTLFLISTPNPFSIRQMFSILLFGRPGMNPEHTVAIDPLNFMEIMSRTGLELVDFRWLHETRKPVKSYNKVLYIFYRLMYSARRYWAPNYLVILKIAGK